MTQTPADTVPSGIAILAESGDLDWEDGPFQVRGVALPEEITTNGSNTEGVSTYWPADVVERASALFDGAKLVDGSEHTAEKAMENPQPSPETIVGEITAARYKPGVGVLYEAELDDPELAKRVDRGRVDVSPTLYRTLDGETESGARIASDVKAVRDIAIVAKGAAEGNSIEPATSTAMSALTADALSAAFDRSERAGADALAARVHTPSYDGTTTSSWSAPVLDDFTDQQFDDLSAADRNAIADHFVVSFSGFPPRNFSGLSLPVVDVDGNLNLSALQNAKARLSQVEGLNADERDRVASVINRLANENFDSANFGAEANAASGDDPQGASTGGRGTTADTDGPGTTGPEDTMTDDDNTITDDQRRLLEALGALSIEAMKAVDVLQTFDGHDEPTIVEQTEYEALQEDLVEAKGVLADALAERTGMDAEKIAENFSWAALREEFEDDEGNLAVEALVQEPETGDTDASGDDTGPSDEDKQRIEQINTKLSLAGSALPTERIAALQEEACELAGVEDYSEVVEAL